MHPFLFKSLLSLLVLISLCIGVVTMFKIYGRDRRRQNAELLRKIHRLNGIVFIILTVFLSYLCLLFLSKTGAAPSARGMVHAVFALTVLIILCVKVAITNFFRQYYAVLKTAGFLLVFTAFGMIGTSAGYYLLKTKFGTAPVPMQILGQKDGAPSVAGSRIAVKTDPATIGKGRELYESKCHFCHDAESNKMGVGPGHKGLLKNSLLPVSGRQATPENVVEQLRHPYKNMPSFSHLTDEEVTELISYLHTL